MQTSSTLLLLAGLGLSAAPALAQTASPVPSAKAMAVRDSVFAQAAAIRAESSRLVNRFTSRHLAVGGLRTVTKSYALSAYNIPVPAMKHVLKRKTTGSTVEKITYYNARGREQLREEYQNGQLARLTLLGYEKGQTVQTARFVQGDYLSIERKANPLQLPQERKQPLREYYHYPAAIVAR